MVILITCLIFSIVIGVLFLKIYKMKKAEKKLRQETEKNDAEKLEQLKKVQEKLEIESDRLLYALEFTNFTSEKYSYLVSFFREMTEQTLDVNLEMVNALSERFFYTTKNIEHLVKVTKDYLQKMEQIAVFFDEVEDIRTFPSETKIKEIRDINLLMKKQKKESIEKQLNKLDINEEDKRTINRKFQKYKNVLTEHNYAINIDNVKIQKQKAMIDSSIIQATQNRTQV